MSLELSRKIPWIILVTIGIIFLSPVTLFINDGKTFYVPVTSQPAESIQERERTRAGLPIDLKIPAIGVDTSLVYVGLTPQGAVGVPEGPSNAAWLDLSSRPGEKGTAVIDGHYGWKDNIPAVFNNLSELRIGDKLYVKDENGTTTRFVVRDIETYGENQNPSKVFNSNDGKVHLNLITCEGIWNAVQKSYSDRLVVFADKA